jgi:hypothetical protein
LIPTLAALVVLSTFRAGAQDELSSVATLQLADGTSVALLDWKLTYEIAVWRQKEPVSSAKSQTRQNSMLVLGKRSYPLKGDTLTLTHTQADDTFRVASMTLAKAGDLKVENPARETLAPDLEKNLFYQPRSLDVSGKTLSGIERSFCVASFSALVECGGTATTRVVKIAFN